MRTPNHGRAAFRSITPGIETMRESFALPRHRHLTPYASLVLSGTLDEAGYNGRIQAQPGDVLIHPAMDSHANCKVMAGLRLIRLPWSHPEIQSGLYQIDNLDQIAMLAERDPCAASLLLAETLASHLALSPRTKNDWPDLLAAQLCQNCVPCLGRWARSHGLVPETVSRGFALAFGVSPELFRAEVRASIAWRRIAAGDDALAAIAADTGFADQAHMTRWVLRTSGATPRAWRMQITKSSDRAAQFPNAPIGPGPGTCPASQ